MTTQTNRLVITAGEPAGIGPEQVIMLAQKKWDFEWIVVSNETLIRDRAAQLGLPINIESFDPSSHQNSKRMPNQPQQIKLVDIPLSVPCKTGELNEHNAQFVIDMLHHAIDGCMNNDYDAMVTGPIHKGVINQAGIAFSGHTELLAQRSETEQVVMMLATPGLRVPLVTTHLPLSAVPSAITSTKLENVIRITHNALKTQFGIQTPAIYIAGLNPHAGEDGHMGREEIDVINPVIDKLKQEGMNLIGPLPADTMFTPPNIKKSDAMLAMYHDQGLPVLKHVGFGNAVNVTLGLPFVRTSVDHGTALDIAGQGIASATSFEYAMQVAVEMCAGTNTLESS